MWLLDFKEWLSSKLNSREEKKKQKKPDGWMLRLMSEDIRGVGCYECKHVKYARFKKYPSGNKMRFCEFDQKWVEEGVLSCNKRNVDGYNMYQQLPMLYACENCINMHGLKAHTERPRYDMGCFVCGNNTGQKVVPLMYPEPQVLREWIKEGKKSGKDV